MKKVFLGGTCNESKWRDEVISMLKIDYFNPVVEDWTTECQADNGQLFQESLYLCEIIGNIYSNSELLK